MSLTWRDAVATVLAAAVVLVLLAVTLGWGWPLITNYWVAAVVLWVLGVVMCPLAWFGVQAAFGDREARVALDSQLGVNRTYYWFMSLLALAATVLLVWGVIAPALAVVVALAAVVIGMWLITTARHAIVPARRTRAPGTAAPA